MDDRRIHQTIDQLVEERQALLGLEAAGYATEVDRRRMRELQVSLDQCCDLLRRRGALEEHGMNPDAARVRPPEMVARYEQ
jgi:Protein of unknown function (DUF2630)